MRKEVVLFFCVLLVSLMLVVAQDVLDKTDDEPVDEAVDIKKLVDDFAGIKTGDGDALSGKLNGLSSEDKKSFFDEIESRSGVKGVGDLVDKFADSDVFDKDGNVVLSNGQKVPLSDIQNYADKVNNDEAGFGYVFRGESFSSDLPGISEVKVDGDTISYEFENGAALSLSDGAEFDFENRKIMVGGEGVEWMNMKGEVIANSNSVETNVVLGEGESKLKDFPILKDSAGEIVSPYHDSRGVDSELPDGFKKPSAGKFATFEKDGKTYTVNSDGGVRQLKNPGISFNDKGEIDKISDGFIDKGEAGDVFVTGDTIIARGDEPPTDKSKNYIWFGEDGKVSLNAVSGDLYYIQKKDLKDMELNGNVVVKNGDYLLTGDQEGNIIVRKEGTGDDKGLEFGIEKLYSEKKKEDWIAIKKYEGEEELFKGKLVVYNKDGEVIFGGVVKISDLEFAGISDEVKAVIDRNIASQRGDTITKIHEGYHFATKDLIAVLNTGGTPGYELGVGSMPFIIEDENGNMNVAILKTTGIRKGSLVSSIPSELTAKFTTESYFFPDSQVTIKSLKGGVDFSNRDALHTVDDWASNMAGMSAIIENPSLGKGQQAGQMYTAHDFMITSSVLGKELSKNSEYWDSDAGEQYRGFLKTGVERTMGYYEKAKSDPQLQYLVTPRNDDDSGRMDIEQRMTSLRTSNDPNTASLRNFYTETYGSAWTQQYLGY